MRGFEEAEYVKERKDRPNMAEVATRQRWTRFRELAGGRRRAVGFKHEEGFANVGLFSSKALRQVQQHQ